MRKFLTTLLLLAFMMPFAMRADEVIIGNGTDYDASVPFNTPWRYSWNETIYPGSEIGGAATINAISFNCNAGEDGVNPVTLTEVDVYMGITERESMSSLLDWTPESQLSLVYSGENLVIGDTPWEEIILDVPFYYTGEGNLVVVVAKRMSGYSTKLKWYYTSVDNTVLYRANDSSPDIADNHPGANQATHRLSYRVNMKLDVTYGSVQSPITLNPASLDLGFRPDGCWMRPVNVDIITENEEAKIISLASTNPFFVLTPVEMPHEMAADDTLSVKVTHLAGVDGEQNGKLLVSHDFGIDSVMLTATAYTPAMSDVWEMPVVISELPYTNTPAFNTLYNNYLLPGEAEDGPDAVYRIYLQNETTLSAVVNGENGKIALYEDHFKGKGGPDFDNYFGSDYVPENPDDPFPEIMGSTFSEDFNDGSLEDWKIIDADGDFRNWAISPDGIPGVDGTKCVYSESWHAGTGSPLTPDNIIATKGLYTITENSVLSFDAAPQGNSASFCAENFGVVVSSDGVNFTTIWHHTVTANEIDWKHYDIDLGEYANHNLYVGIRHYDCTNEYAIRIDNLVLSDGTTRGAKSNTIENLVVPAGVYYLVASATSEFTVSVLTDNTVSEVVAEEIDENNAKAYWSWNFINTKLSFESGKTIENPKNSKGFDNYKLYRRNIFDNSEAILIADNLTDTVYVDNTWGAAQAGVYQYGVSVVYSNDKFESPIVWSNKLDKNMNVTVTVNVEAENGASVEGAEVSFVNVNESEYVYEVTLGATGSHTWNDFRVGTYEYSVMLDGFRPNNATIEITESTEIECVLKEYFAVGDIYVSSTAWAMWNDDAASYEIFLDGQSVAEVTTKYYQYDVTNLVAGQEYTTKVVGENELEYTWTYNPSDKFVEVSDYVAELNEKNVELSWTLPIQGTGECASEFMYDFEDGTLNGFITLDANADGRIWVNSTAVSQTDCGYESANSAVSRSYDGLYDLEPDDYLVTADKYAITENSKLTFRVCAENSMYAAEHYGVAISTVSNVLPSAFTMIWEETLEAKSDAKVERGERAQGNWYLKTIDLSAYAGQNVYIALRHFNCFGQFWINIDNLTLTADAKATANDGEWLHYDDDTNLDAIGLTNGSTLNWGVMFPTDLLTAHAGKVLSRVSIYDKTAHDGEFKIYFGGDAAPATLMHTQNYSCTGSGEFVEFELTRPLELTAEQNLWVVFTNHNGQFVASCCTGTGDPNGRWISFNGNEWLDVNEQTGYDLTWQIRAYVEAPKEPNYTEHEVLGAMVFRNGELLTPEPITEETFVDVNPGYGEFEYSVKVVFGGEEDSYYAMSNPQSKTILIERTCTAPRNLYGEEAMTEDGNFGVSLVWPYTLQGSEWLYYDNGTYATNIGLGGSPFYWGIKFPKESLEFYGGTMMTKVSVYDCEAHTGNLLFYYGGDNAPDLLVHTQPYVLSGAQNFVELELTVPLPIDPSMNLWIVFNSNGGSYPAASCNNTGDPNGRWISMDGNTWQDVMVANPQLAYTWMIRAFVTSESKEVVELTSEPLEYENNAVGGMPVANPNPVRDNVFQHYNVYRGSSNDDYELIAETTEGAYFDEVEIGTYYYKVTAVYTVDGEDCESAPANAYGSENQKFVVVDVTAINENGVSAMMIYPNPTKDMITITAENMNRITVINALGQVVFDKEVNTDNISLDMSQFDAAIYMLRITTDNGVAVERVSVVK